MASDQLTLVLLAAFRAGTSAIISGIKILNETRDRIIVGIMDGKVMSIEHRRQLLNHDWIPLRLGLASVSLVLAIIIISLPYLANREIMKPGFSTVCYITALVPFCGFLNFLVFGISEWRFMKRELLRTAA